MQSITEAPILRWALALFWTGVIMVLMLTPSDRPVVEDTSNIFGGTDLTDAVGHVILFGVLAVAWWAAFACHWEGPTAFWRAMGLVAILGAILEIAQYWVPERGLAAIDLAANLMGVGVVIAATRWYWRR